MIRDVQVKLDTESDATSEWFSIRLYITVQDGDRKVSVPWLVKEFDNRAEAVRFGNQLREMIENG